MKINFLFGLIAITFLFSIPSSFAVETDQEPGPPGLPEPSPEPKPIPLPEPEPVPDPFPGETESEKIQRLTEENEKLKQQNKNLQGQISTLKNEKSGLQSQISQLHDRIKDLEQITIEQLRVIMDLVNRLKDVFYEKIISPTINM